MIVTIIGTGLIGGSMALTLKEKGFASKVIGVDASEQHLVLLMKRILYKMPLRYLI
jgi:prephenate dehydrogenase